MPCGRVYGVLVTAPSRSAYAQAIGTLHKRGTMSQQASPLPIDGGEIHHFELDPMRHACEAWSPLRPRGPARPSR